MAQRKKQPKKTVNLDLCGLDGNAFVLMGAFQRQARREGWPQEEIDKVIEEAQSSNYDHLLATLAQHCQVESEENVDDPA